MRCLDKQYPFLMKYFDNGIASQNRQISHCILFYGSDIQSQYELALEIARMLNCTGDHTENCQCLNCKWIRENNHPAVLTISKVDNKPSDDTSKTVISIDQARMIKNDLLVTSDYHRVLIFCDRDKEGNIQGLNQLNFQADAANALLKTFEEPPSNTTFIFLTKDKSDMITTVVSRAQCFYVPSMKDEDRDFSLVKEVMDGGFVQLIYNGLGPFVFFNPFAKAVRAWGIDDLATLINRAGRLFRKYGKEITRECSDEEFMAMFEKYSEFDNLDDEFVENEERWIGCIARYIDEHIDNFATIEEAEGK